MIHIKPTSADEAPLGGNRRRFLLGALSIAAAPLVMDAFGKSRLMTEIPTPPSGISPTLEVFQQCIGGTFTEIGSGHALLLAKVEPVTQRRQPCDIEQFSLYFTSSAGKEIESRIYEMEHPQLGRIDLFLSPVGSCIRFGELQNGEAVISRLLKLA